MSTDGKRSSEGNNDEDNEKRKVDGKALHREFVGMLFALAIAEVAIQASVAVNSGIGFQKCLPAYSHLALAACLIATSWVGWGWSTRSLSDIRSVFSRNFVELVVDLLLVGVYFFIAKGAELPDKNGVVTPSLVNETKWMPVVFILYLLWDVLTKLFEGPRVVNGRWPIVQRGWGTVLCLIMAFGAKSHLAGISNVTTSNVLTADGALLCLVFLFRAAKAKDFSDMQKRDWALVFPKRTSQNLVSRMPKRPTFGCLLYTSDAADE